MVSTLCTTLYNFESFIIFPVELFDLSKLDCQNDCCLLVKGRNVIINKNSVTTIKEFYVLNFFFFDEKERGLFNRQLPEKMGNSCPKAHFNSSGQASNF